MINNKQTALLETFLADFPLERSLGEEMYALAQAIVASLEKESCRPAVENWVKKIVEEGIHDTIS